MSVIQGLKDLIVAKYGYEVWRRMVEERREQLMMYVLDGNIDQFLEELGDIGFGNVTPEDTAQIISVVESGVFPKSKVSQTFHSRITLSKNFWMKCSDVSGVISTLLNQTAGTGTEPTVLSTNLGEIWLPKGTKLKTYNISGYVTDPKLKDIQVRIKLIGKNGGYESITQANVESLYSGLLVDNLKTNAYSTNNIDLGDYELTEDRQVCFYYSTNSDVSNKTFTGSRTLIYTLP